jgi:hypothetical protein
MTKVRVIAMSVLLASTAPLLDLRATIIDGYLKWLTDHVTQSGGVYEPEYWARFSPLRVLVHEMPGPRN